MFYRLIVNAAFLAIGYYIGREVGRSMASEPRDSEEPVENGMQETAASEPREGFPPGEA